MCSGPSRSAGPSRCASSRGACRCLRLSVRRLVSLGQTLLWAQLSTSTAPIGSISTSMDGLFDAAWMCGSVAYFGLLVLGYYLAGLADWYDDTELSQRFRNSIFLLFVVPLPLM